MGQFEQANRIHTLGLANSEVRQRFKSYLSNIQRKSVDKLFDDHMLKALRQYGGDQRFIDSVRHHARRVGYAASIKEPAQLDQALQRFTEKNHSMRARFNPHFQAAKEQMIQEFSSLGKVSMLSYAPDSYLAYLPKTDTHAGYLYLQHGKRLKNEYDVEEVAALYKEAVVRAKRHGTLGYPMLIGHRTQGGGAFDDQGNPIDEVSHKTRLISMFDLRHILIENQFAYPFQGIINESTFYAGGKEPHVLHGNIVRANLNTAHWQSIDYSSYDQTVSQWLIREAFDVVRSCFVNEGFDEDLWNVVVNDFIYKTFIDVQGNLVKSEKGIPSGSRFTQIIGSIVNRLAILTFLRSKGYNPESHMFIMGDDNLFFTSRPVDMEVLSSYLMDNFGLEASAEKSSNGSRDQSPEFLSRTWTSLGIYREPWVLVLKLLHPERFRNYEKVTESGEPELIPEDIIYNYVREFPLGMGKIIGSQSEFSNLVRNKTRKELRDLHPSTGLQRVRIAEKIRPAARQDDTA